MTRIVVSEILCGGGWVEPGRFGDWAPALLGEAWAMLSSVTADFAAISGAQVTTILDQRLSDRALDPRVQVVSIAPEDEERAFQDHAAQADYAMVIAPEIDGILQRRCELAVAAGAKLLGPDPKAIALTSDKLILARYWQEAGIPTPQTEALQDRAPSFPPPWIVKPRRGAGSVGVARVHSAAELPAIDDGVIQPLIPGLAASVAFLIGPLQTLALAPCRQHLDEQFQYLGGSTPLPPDEAFRAIAVARPAVEAVPGLRGYIGIDVVLGESDWAIEINPRMTTSYIGLRQLAYDNLAEAMLRVVRGESVELAWRESQVEFRANDAWKAAL